jgi:hypothetical protein
MSRPFLRLSARLLGDDRLLQSHISLVFALLITWLKSGNKVHFKITRREMMTLSKISSVSTYHNCINDLVKYNYIDYNPSYNHYTGTHVSFKF